MSRRDPIHTAFLLILAALGSQTGCTSLRPRVREHASTSLLETGPTAKVSNRQAADMQIELGRSMEQEGKPEEARTSYIAALQNDPKRGDAESRLAILDDKKGDQAAADAHFDRALKLSPKDPEILCDRAYSFYLRRRWADAEGYLKSALAVEPKHARSHCNLGLLHARQGDSNAALAEFAKAGCDASDARSNLALVLAMEGRFEESKQQYARALAFKPSSSLAKEGLTASTLALNGKANPRAIASTGARPSVDPALQKTSNSMPR